MTRFQTFRTDQERIAELEQGIRDRDLVVQALLAKLEATSVWMDQSTMVGSSLFPPAATVEYVKSDDPPRFGVRLRGPGPRDHTPQCELTIDLGDGQQRCILREYHQQDHQTTTGVTWKHDRSRRPFAVQTKDGTPFRGEVTS